MSIKQLTEDMIWIIPVRVFIDLKKPFDTIDHKLERYGTQGLALNGLNRYMKYRQQFVQLGNCKSSLLNLSCGVPQGSIVGPKLFILYLTHTPGGVKIRVGKGACENNSYFSKNVFFNVQKGYKFSYLKGLESHDIGTLKNNFNPRQKN